MRTCQPTSGPSAASSSPAAAQSSRYAALCQARTISTLSVTASWILPMLIYNTEGTLQAHGELPERTNLSALIPGNRSHSGRVWMGVSLCTQQVPPWQELMNCVSGAQAISEPDERYEAYCASSDFIREHIFPGGHLPSMGAMVDAARGTGLTVQVPVWP